MVLAPRRIRKRVTRKVKTISSDVAHAKWMKDPEYRAAYEAASPAEHIAIKLVVARSRAKLTQAELAARMKTTQSVVARLESGKSLPSMSSLQRYAAALGKRVSVEIG